MIKYYLFGSGLLIFLNSCTSSQTTVKYPYFQIIGYKVDVKSQSLQEVEEFDSLFAPSCYTIKMKVKTNFPDSTIVETIYNDISVVRLNEPTMSIDTVKNGLLEGTFDICNETSSRIRFRIYDDGQLVDLDTAFNLQKGEYRYREDILFEYQVEVGIISFLSDKGWLDTTQFDLLESHTLDNISRHIQLSDDDRIEWN